MQILCASHEEFTYNSFGQVLTHRLKNGAWESFVYDGRGLLTNKYNPKADCPRAAAILIHTIAIIPASMGSPAGLTG